MSATLGRYRLLERLGAGGMADVWRAVAEGPEGFSRTVVIKRVLGTLQTDASFIQMFLNEARLSAMLQHPNIVQVFDLGEVDGEYYLAMEHVDGIELRELLHRALQRGRTMPVADACHVIAEVAAALGYAHAARDQQGRPLQIVHRDVTPSNVMVTRHGEVKLLDFGIAKAAEHVRDERTRTGTLKGKFGYMSPEQAEAKPVDARSDIFSLGIVFWECLTMRRLFRTTDDLQTIQQVREANVSAPSRLRPEVPPVLDALVLKMLARDPAERYPSCDRLLDELVPLSQALGGRAHGLRGFVEEMMAPEHDTVAVTLPETKGPVGNTTGPQATIIDDADAAPAAPVELEADAGDDAEAEEEATLISVTPMPPPPGDTAPLPAVGETAPLPRAPVDVGDVDDLPEGPTLDLGAAPTKSATAAAPEVLAATVPLRAIHAPEPLPAAPSPLSSPAISVPEGASPSLKPQLPWKPIGAIAGGIVVIVVIVLLARPRAAVVVVPEPAAVAASPTAPVPVALPADTPPPREAAGSRELATARQVTAPPREAAATHTPEASPVEVVHLAVDGTTGADVELDGHSLGAVPLRATVPRDDQAHTVIVRKRGFEPLVRHIRTSDDQRLRAVLRRARRGAD